MCSVASDDAAISIDYFVCETEQSVGNCEAKRSGGCAIDHKFGFGGSQDRKLRGQFALEDSTHIDPGLAMRIRKVCAEAHQTTRCGVITRESLHRGQPVVCGERDNSIAVAGIRVIGNK